MAQNILCDLCEQEPGMLMQSNISNGDVITVGESCMLIFLLTTAGSILDQMPADNARQYAQALDPIVAKLALVVLSADTDEGPVTGDMAPLIDDTDMRGWPEAEVPPVGPAPATAVAGRPRKGA
jgi:hypothetical protein